MANTQITELYKSNKTPHYNEVITHYKTLANNWEYMQLLEYGPTDSGEPLHLIVVDIDKDFNPVSIRAKGKSILFINNGIHPGEPDGIDACLKLLNELSVAKDLNEQLKNVVLCIIPVYNIDGALNRNSTSRVNQDGPEEFGFRGNAQNYDLNRDFIKCESLNAQSFTEIFRTWDPDIFVDTHVSNGADYQYVMTLIATQHSKLQEPLGTYLKQNMLPELYSGIAETGYPMCPYINEIKRTPDEGISGFLDLGRYSTGYTALFNTLGFMPETHMLKPYPQRVESTYELLKVYIEFTNTHSSEIISIREQAKNNCKNANEFAINWELDMNNKELFLFKGYEAKYKTSEVSGLQRLYYDRNEPYEKNIPFYDTYTANLLITAPVAYVIPKAWRDIIDRLSLNKITMKPLEQDSLMEVEVYYIEDLKNTSAAFEGHYLHSEIKVRKEIQKLQYYKGDILVYVNQTSNNYIVQTLEPQAPDSFFAWGFFDAILMQKEWFSDYVFEDIAAELLKTDPELKAKLTEKQKADPEFAASAWAQLRFVYENSIYHEKSHNRYPVGRLMSN